MPMMAMPMMMTAMMPCMPMMGMGMHVGGYGGMQHSHVVSYIALVTAVPTPMVLYWE